MTAAPPARTFDDWALMAFGAVLIVLGLPSFVGGAWLALGGGSSYVLHGGSSYYVFVGLGLIASGALLVLRRPEGGWLYAAVFVATLIWAFWDIGSVGWSLVRRVVGPTVLALILLCFVPVLRRWAILHERPILSPMTAFLIVAGVMLAVFGVEFGATKLFPAS